jgi:protein-tyrosine phosphatase
MMRRRTKLYIACSVGLLSLLGLFHLGIEWWTREGPNYSPVEDGLYMGGSVRRPPPGTTAVLNLCETPDPYQAEVHAWEPIADAEPAPTLDWLRQRVQFIAEHRRVGRVVYVHCQNGVSRSGMVVTAYLMSEHQWSRDQALAFVRSRRPAVRPNPAFMAHLAEWEQVVRGR